MSALLLEDPVPVRFEIIGTEQWLRASIPPEDLRKYALRCIRSAADLDPIYCYLGSQLLLMWDTETTGDPTRKKDGLHPHSKTSRMVLFQVGTRDIVYLVQPELLRMYPHFKMLMENQNIIHVAQNELFDFKFMLAKYGIHIVNMFCTMLAEQVLTAGQKGIKANLRSIVRRYRPCLTISKEVREEFTTFNGILTEKILYYAARDVALMFAVYDQQSTRLVEADLTQVAELEFNCIPVTAEMELSGLIIVPETLQLTLEYNTGEANRVQAEINRIYNAAMQTRGVVRQGLFSDEEYRPVTLDLGSVKDKLAALHALGLDVTSTDSEVLEQLDHPIGPLIAEWMGYSKIITTYGERLINMIHPDTNRFHPRFLQMGEGESSELDKTQSGSSEKGTTATGRYSSDAQQFPKEKKVYAKVTDPALIHQLHGRFLAIAA